MNAIRHVVLPGGRLDRGRVLSLQAEIDAAAHERQRVVLDFRLVDAIDARCIATIVSLQHNGPGAPRLVLAALQPQIQELAIETLLHELFDIYVSSAAALAHLSALTPAPE